MSTPDIPTYTSKVVPVPNHVAPVVFEQWCRTLDRSAGSRLETVEVELGRLVLDPTTWDWSTVGQAAPSRRVCGKLRVSSWGSRHRAWPVELELTPWSKTSSELGLRFTGRRLPSVGGVVRYHRLAALVLDAIASAMLELCPQDLTDADMRRPSAA